MLAVIKSYVIIPWWAWTASWLNAAWSISILITATRAALRSRRLAKEGEEFLGGMVERLGDMPLPIPMYGMDPKQSVN